MRFYLKPLFCLPANLTFRLPTLCRNYPRNP
nr:MAG TPA: hypothetical protein [Caudoviricetes sp.]